MDDIPVFDCLLLLSLLVSFVLTGCALSCFWPGHTLSVYAFFPVLHHRLCERLFDLAKVGSVGITTGEAFCGVVGSKTRKEYTVLVSKVFLVEFRRFVAAVGFLMLTHRSTP